MVFSWIFFRLVFIVGTLILTLWLYIRHIFINLITVCISKKGVLQRVEIVMFLNVSNNQPSHEGFIQWSKEIMCLMSVNNRYSGLIRANIRYDKNGGKLYGKTVYPLRSGRTRTRQRLRRSSLWLQLIARSL